MIFTNTKNNHDEIIELVINITQICNYKCSYCYVKTNLSKPIIDIKLIKMICFYIKRAQNNFIITLMGGEPTLHPKLKLIIKLFSNLRNVLKIRCYTNGHKFIDIKDTKLIWNCTFHSEQTEYNDFIKNILEFSKNNNVIIQLLIDKRFKEKIKNFNNFYQKNVSINPIYLINFKNNKPILNNTFLVENEKEKIINFNNKMFSNLEFWQTCSHDFFDWECFLNMYTIDILGNIFEGCTEKYIGKVSIIENLKCKSITCKKHECLTLCFNDATKKK